MTYGCQTMDAQSENVENNLVRLKKYEVTEGCLRGWRKKNYWMIDRRNLRYKKRMCDIWKNVHVALKTNHICDDNEKNDIFKNRISIRHI